MTKDTTNSLSHTRWKCKYHLVFAPKFRRQIVYGKIRGGENASFALQGATAFNTICGVQASGCGTDYEY